MKIIFKDLKHGEIKLIPENLDDIWHLYNVIEEGDLIRAITFRTTDEKDDKIRSKKTEKKRMKLDIEVEKVSFHPFSDRLRIHGIIKEGPQDLGMHHTFNVDADKMDKISIFKQEWKSHHLQRIDEAVRLRKQAALIFVSLDEDIATIALLRQSGVQRIADIDSKRSGKMYASKETMKDFFNEILTVIKITKEKDSPLVVVGPGFTKENFILYGKTKEPLLFTQCLYYGTGAAGMNGIQEAIKKGVIERITKENRVIFETNLIDKLFEEIKKDGLATYGEQEVNSALTRGAVDRLLISDILVRSQKGEEFLRLARENKSQFTIINTLHDSGKKFEGLGGIGAFLRYKIK